jgi:hypothetical protein
MTNLKMLLCACALAVAVTSKDTYSAEDQQETSVRIGGGKYTYWASNGNAWKILAPQSRLTLLLGLEEGAHLVIVRMEAEGRSAKSIDDTIGTVGALMVGGFKFPTW